MALTTSDYLWSLRSPTKHQIIDEQRRHAEQLRPIIERIEVQKRLLEYINRKKQILLLL